MPLPMTRSDPLERFDRSPFTFRSAESSDTDKSRKSITWMANPHCGGSRDVARRSQRTGLRTEIALGICCAFALFTLNVRAGELGIKTQTNEEGMIDSIVIVPGTKALQDVRLKFRGVIQNFDPRREHLKEFVTNEDQTIIGPNVKQATKQNDVYLLLRNSEGNLK
jgi:hypothetical protein